MEKLPYARDVMKRGWPFLIVMVFLVWGLLWMRWEYYAPWYASALMIGLSFLQRETMMTPRRLFQTLRRVGMLVTQTAAIIMQLERKLFRRFATW